jgi:hypothetical protein
MGKIAGKAPNEEHGVMFETREVTRISGANCRCYRARNEPTEALETRAGSRAYVHSSRITAAAPVVVVVSGRSASR